MTELSWRWIVLMLTAPAIVGTLAVDLILIAYVFFAAWVSRRPIGPTLALRRKLAHVYLQGELLKLISDRAISAEVHGRAVGPEGSIAKLLWSELEQHVVEVAGDVLAPDGLTGGWGRDRVYSRALTIAGGTTQVNKNIVAQRILGLPRG
jgi:alkylation response protein AidB-like acyl-CoA dehydrogenase